MERDAEAIVVVSGKELPNEEGVIDPKVLCPEYEIFLPWNKEFIQWHTEHFDERIKPYITLDDTTIAHYFLNQKNWLFASYTMSERLRKHGAFVYTLYDNPPRQIIYCLSAKTGKQAQAEVFLKLLDEYLKTLPQKWIGSLLS